MPQGAQATSETPRLPSQSHRARNAEDNVCHDHGHRAPYLVMHRRSIDDAFHPHTRHRIHSPSRRKGRGKKANGDATHRTPVWPVHANRDQAERRRRRQEWHEGLNSLAERGSLHHMAQNKKGLEFSRPFPSIHGRGERIRTSDSCVPNAVLYQAELHPDASRLLIRSCNSEERQL